MTDELIEDVRKAGQAYIESFKGDDQAMVKDLRRRAQDEGRQVVTLPPKSPREQNVQYRRSGTA
jgi:hypothetical protein